MITNIPLVLETVAGFVVGVQAAVERPVYSWVKLQDGTLHVEVRASDPPLSVTVWSAHTIDHQQRRDFRLVALTNTSSSGGGGGMKPWLHPVLWAQSAELVPTSRNESLIVYDALVGAPAAGQGWTGFVVELVWPGALNATTFRVSTAVSILPQTFPYPDCFMETCAGPLV